MDDGYPYPRQAWRFQTTQLLWTFFLSLLLLLTVYHVYDDNISLQEH